MRNRLHCTLLLVSLCLGGLPVGLWAQADVNTPWDPAAHLVPYWESVVATARLCNLARDPEADPDEQRQLSITGAIELIDYGDLVGIDRKVKNVVALDHDGTEIYRGDNGLGSRSYQATESARRLTLLNQRVDEVVYGVRIPMHPNRGYPSSIGRLEWSMDTLIAGAFYAVDVPFEPNETWIELIPGLEILVEEASVQEGKYTYTIQAIYDSNIVPYGISEHLWRFEVDEVPPARLLARTDVLNAAGRSVRNSSLPGDFDSSTLLRTSDDGLMNATIRAHGSCDVCGDVVTIRYTFALEPYEREVRFVLEEIPVPGF
jgi:hypothetical protein